MTLQRRVQDVERRTGGRRKEPHEMTNAELWLTVLRGLDCPPDAELQSAIEQLRAMTAAGEHVAPDWGMALIQRVAPSLSGRGQP